MLFGGVVLDVDGDLLLADDHAVRVDHQAGGALVGVGTAGGGAGAQGVDHRPGQIGDHAAAQGDALVGGLEADHDRLGGKALAQVVDEAAQVLRRSGVGLGQV